MLVDLFPPFLGGKEGYVSELSKALCKNGHTLSVVTLSIPSYNLPPVEWVDGVKIVRISGGVQRIGMLYGGSKVRPNLPIRDLALTRRLLGTIKDVQPEVVICHSNFLYSVQPLTAQLRIPLIVTLHDYGFICPIGNLLYKHTSLCSKQYSLSCLKCVTVTSGVMKAIAGYILYQVNRRAISSVDKFVAVSQGVKDIYIKATNLPGDKIDVVYNFYSPHNESALPLECRKEFPKRFILYVGAFSFQKGVHVLLEAFRNIRGRMPSDIKLLMIVASQEGNVPVCDEGVVVMMNQPRPVVMEAWRRCLFGVVPSIWLDPCPTVALEAMSEGKALIASNVGGLREMIVHEDTGLVVESGDTNGLGKAILRLVQDGEAVNRYGENARSRFNDCFRVEETVAAYERILEEVVSGQKLRSVFDP